MNFPKSAILHDFLMPRRMWNTWLAGLLFSLSGIALSAQNGKPQLGVVNIAMLPVDVSVEARPNILLQSTVHVSASATSQTLESAPTSSSAFGTKPGVPSSFSSATLSVWGPQATTVPASLSASNWNPNNRQSAGCKVQSNEENWKGGQKARSNTAPGNESKDLNGSAPCAANAANGQAAMLGNWADRKAENRNLTTSRSPDSRRTHLRLQMTNASANGILHYQSGSPDASEPSFSNSASGRLKARSSQNSRSLSEADSNPFLLTAEASSPGTPKAERSQWMGSMRRGGHHRRGRHGGSTNQQSSEHCPGSKSRMPSGSSPGGRCEPILNGEANRATNLLD